MPNTESKSTRIVIKNLPPATSFFELVDALRHTGEM